MLLPLADAMLAQTPYLELCHSSRSPWKPPQLQKQTLIIVCRQSICMSKPKFLRYQVPAARQSTRCLCSPHKYLVGHNHNPQQEYLAHHGKRENGLPALADALLFKPCQRLNCLTFRQRVRAEDKVIAIRADGPCRPKQLHRYDDEAHEPQDKNYKAADHDNRWQQPPLEDEPEEQNDKGDCEGRDGDVVREVPVAMLLAWSGWRVTWDIPRYRQQ